MTYTSNENKGCLAALLGLFGGSSNRAPVPDFREPSLTDAELYGPAAPTFPYRVRDEFLSPTERAFYQVLVQAVQDRAVICMKVRLADVFFVARPHENRAAFNRIAQKHIDFLLCNSQSFRPILGIEVDDSSHSRLDRQERDEFVNHTFAAANIPLLHVRAQRTYLIEQVAASIAPYLGGVAQALPPSDTTRNIVQEPVVQADAAPMCRNCGIPLVIRTVTKGVNQGKRFYGCRNYPNCREMRPLDT